MEVLYMAAPEFGENMLLSTSCSNSEVMVSQSLLMGFPETAG